MNPIRDMHIPSVPQQSPAVAKEILFCRTGFGEITILIYLAIWRIELSWVKGEENEVEIRKEL